MDCISQSLKESRIHLLIKTYSIVITSIQTSTNSHYGLLNPRMEQHLHSFIKDTENIGYELSFRLYQLLDDTSYLETAYKQVQDKTSEMEEGLGKKLLSYSLPKAIVEEYNKVFKK